MNDPLVIGGARSGKSRFASDLARSLTPRPVMLATSRPWDDDHRARIERHVRDRGPEWRTVEEERRLSAIGFRHEVVVVDCITLWLTNVFIDMGRDPERCLVEAKAEVERVLLVPNQWIFVTNELGQGVHAPDASTRAFVDLQGFVNQHLASRVDDVVLMVAGIPLTVKEKGHVR